jgi:hypothetical protein
MSARRADIQTSARSPFAGCAILITALLVMVFLVVFSVITLFRQFNEIARFTGEKPQPVELTQVEGREADLNRLAEKIELFRQQLAGTGEARLALGPEELNLAIAAYEPFKDLRGTFRVLSADDGRLRVAISFPMNGRPRFTREGEEGMITSDMRYLNGTLVASPALLKREVVLRIENIEVPGATVPREFIEQMSPYRITERYLTDPQIGPAMAGLTRVSVEDGGLVFAKVPGEVPQDVIGRDQVNHATSRLFVVIGVAASIFLLFAGTVIFLGLRAKAGRTGN